MNTESYFSHDYAEARAKFLKAAEACDAKITSYENPALGPNGEKLTTDVAWLGPANAKKVIITISATHGVEGFAGSAIQSGWFETGEALKNLRPDMALLAIHANNPYGFAWLRRFNEDNIDVNRNFIDFDEKLPENKGYDELAKALCPTKWTFLVRTLTLLRIGIYKEIHGEPATQKATSHGQYHYPKGIFYGGSKPTLSRSNLFEILETALKNVEFAAVVDIHTGLGECAADEEICNLSKADSARINKAKEWYGLGCKSPELDGDKSVSGGVKGNCVRGIVEKFPDKMVTGISLEFGTQPALKALTAVRADTWLQFYGDQNSIKGREIKQQIRDAFYCDDPNWKNTIFEKGVEILNITCEKLSEVTKIPS